MSDPVALTQAIVKGLRAAPQRVMTGLGAMKAAARAVVQPELARLGLAGVDPFTWAGRQRILTARARAEGEASMQEWDAIIGRLDAMNADQGSWRQKLWTKQTFDPGGADIPDAELAGKPYDAAADLAGVGGPAGGA